jgi:hypothetical protein
LTRTLAILAAAVACLLTAPAAASALVVGIADQKPQMFSDPLFQNLGVRHARLVVPWDVLHQSWSRDELDQWMQAAHAAGVRPLLTFGHSRVDAKRHFLPSPRRVQIEFKLLRARYPWAMEWATWNEPNHCGEPTCKHPKVVARYHDALRRACRGCTILASEVLDMPNMASWVRRFTAATRIRPLRWGLHNYIDANRFRTTGTRALLRATTGPIWFTETGGVLRRQDRRHRVEFPGGSMHAARATRWLFDRLVALDRRRVTRVYLYQWSPGTDAAETWDSGLVSPRGTPRAALRVLEGALNKLRRQAARR